jgi:hypothetical protein
MYTLMGPSRAGALTPADAGQGRRANPDTTRTGLGRSVALVSPGRGHGGGEVPNGVAQSVPGAGDDASGTPADGISSDDEWATRPTAARVLRRARRRRGWSQPRLATEMHRVARACQRVLPGVDSLKTMISRWENGHRVPDTYNREVVCAALGIPVSALGLPDDIDEDAS